MTKRAVAAQADRAARSAAFGPRVGDLFRGRLTLWSPGASRLVLMTALLAVTVAVWGSFPAGAVLFATTVLAVFGYLYTTEPPAGRDWFAVHDDGLVCVNGDRVTVLRWADVDEVVHRFRRVELTLVGPDRRKVVYPETYLVRWPGGELRLTPVGRVRALIAAVDERVWPVLLEKARAAVRRDGAARFGPLAVGPDSVTVVPADGPPRTAPWPRVEHRLEPGAGLVVLVARHRVDGPLPNAGPCRVLLSELDPAGRPLTLEQAVRDDRRLAADANAQETAAPFVLLGVTALIMLGALVYLLAGT